MIQAIDDYIQARLERIKYGSTALRVYPYIPDREKGETEYPCMAFERMYYKVDNEHAHPDGELFIPSAEQQTLSLRDYSKRYTVSDKTGPTSFTVKPYPTPLNITYEIHTLGTKRAHADGLMEMIFQAFPPGYSDVISTYTVTFWIKESQCVNDLVLPLYRTMVLLEAHGSYLDRIETLTVPSISGTGSDLLIGKKEEGIWQTTQQVN